ncbi:DNA-directed RNA polymerase subunit beta [Halalkalibacter urbisdiaboli]|uniref:DNA-directed RNA polymerase subunit beta n=1 Tax=Halalkalibacter urbisdiaboli TaxID=1960589 RepID=UPI000B43554E|nr:DNA-directed RNA polymerase subunit beta [Halalkalibacter urbisdiaboli]
MSEQEVQKRTEQNKAQDAEKAEAKQDEQRFGRRRPRLRIRLIPIWLRLLIVVVLVGGSLLLGLMVGYGVLGDGVPADALKPETWYHILDIMKPTEKPS